MLEHDWDSSAGGYSQRARSARDATKPDSYLFITRRMIPNLKAIGATDVDVGKLMVDDPRRFFEERG